MRRASSPRPHTPSQHALTQQVAYEMLLQEQRRARHARIVAALEALAGERVPDQVERLAHHALQGEVWGKAVMFCQQAGTRGYDRAAFREGWPTSTRLCRPSRTCPSPATPGCWPSSSASLWSPR